MAYLDTSQDRRIKEITSSLTVGDIGSLVQAWDADLDSISALAGTGIAVRTGSNTWSLRTLVAGPNIQITNPAGLAGDMTIEVDSATINVTLDHGLLLGLGDDDHPHYYNAARLAAEIGVTIQAFDADLSALSALGTTGLAARTAADTWAVRTLTSSNGLLTIANGDGVAGNPTFTVNNGSIDHGTLAGLGDDDHAQYALLAGRAAGQTLFGGSAASEDLTLSSTAHATKDRIFFGSAQTSAFDELNSRLGIGTPTPSNKLTTSGGSDTDGLTMSVAVASTGSPNVIFQKARGTPGAEAAINSGDNLGWLLWRGYESGYQNGPFIRATATQNWVGGAHGAGFVFGVVPDASTTITDALRLHQNQCAAIKGNGALSTPVVNLELNGNDAILIPKGTTAQEPAAVDGYLRYDSTTGKLRAVQGGFWQNVVSPTKPGIYNINFAQGADSSQLKITSAQGAALSASNPGIVAIRSSTAGTVRFFYVTADVTMDLTGAHWGLDTKGNTTGSLLRVYAIDDNGTLRWGVGYQGGFNYIRNTQDDTTASNINLPEEIYTNGNVATDNSPMLDVGYIKANFTDASNEWAITDYFPSESADGIWQQWTTTFGGFSAAPAITDSNWMQIGKTVFLSQTTANGTSNATTFTATAPIKARIAQGGQGNGYLVNNGATLAAAQAGAVWTTTAASVTLDARRDPLGTAWTAANGKRANLTMFYDAYQP